LCPSRGTIEPYHPTFYDGPVLPDNFEATALLASHISIPIATVERLHSIHEFEMLLKRGAVRYVRPDVAGGLTHSKKIAAVAEASYVGVVPHNPLNPVSTAACLQLAACIPNFSIQELPAGEQERPQSEIVKTPLRIEDGFLNRPGHTRHRYGARRRCSREVPTSVTRGRDATSTSTALLSTSRSVYTVRA